MKPRGSEIKKKNHTFTVLEKRLSLCKTHWRVLLGVNCTHLQRTEGTGSLGEKTRFQGLIFVGGTGVFLKGYFPSKRASLQVWLQIGKEWGD